MLSILRNACLAAGALSLSFVLAGCDNGASTTTTGTPAAGTGTVSPAPANPGPDAGKGAMEGPAAVAPKADDAAKHDATPPAEPPKTDAPKDAPK